jgi:hypothetical protein
LEKEETCRNELLAELQEVRKCRTSDLSIGNKTVEDLVLEIELSLDLDLIWSKMPHWIHLSTEHAKTEASKVHTKNERLSKVLKGYKERLGDSIAPSVVAGN